jgi:CBS domain-containing protein
MTREVVTVQPDTPIGEIERLLIERDVPAVPVVDADNRLIGILTNRDLVERGEVAGTAGAPKIAAEVMTRDVASTATDASLSTAAHLMVERRLKRLPVVDASGRLVGMLSRLDVLRTMGEDYHGPGPEAAPRAAAAQTVREVMRLQVPTVAASASLGEVLDAVTSTRLSRAIVLDEQRRVLGVVSDADLLARLDPSGSDLGQRRADVVARDLIRMPLVVAAADTSLAEAVRRMLESRRRVLPITDAEGRFLGAVDRGDVLAQLRRGHE